MRSFLLTFGLALVGCAPSIPDGLYVCASDTDCPANFSCVVQRCRMGCVPQDCQALRANCGWIDDGCGEDIFCGDCGSGACGGGGIPNICACDPLTCQPGINCGPISDGCGGTIDCGLCFGSYACVAGTCTCSNVPSCAGRCGAIVDSCGGIVVCPDCPTGQTCGGGGAPNVCGNGTCLPAVCGPTQCGPIINGCGGTVDCGPCDNSAQVCGAQTPNECGCIQQTCEQLGYQCGTAIDPCTGATLECGDMCPTGTVCGGGGIPNVCGCETHSCDGRCGVIADPCSGSEMNCGMCGAGQTCDDVLHICRCTPDGAEPNDSQPFSHSLGQIKDGDSFTYTDFGVGGPRDDDWYGWSLNLVTMGTRYDFHFELRNIPAGADYDIQLRPVCNNITVIPTVTCNTGTPLGVPGCGSSMTGNADEVVDMRVTGCAVGTVLGAVKVVLFGGTCSSYTMQMTLGTSATGL